MFREWKQLKLVQYDNTSSKHIKPSTLPSVNSYIALGVTLLSLSSAVSADEFSYWASSNESNTQTIDHSSWHNFLGKYIKPSKDGVNLLNYKSVDIQDHEALKKYLTDLSQISPIEFSRKEQMAYWINLYNAATVDLILNHYPVKSITKLGESFFSFGPWNDPITTISERTLTLNNIEHDILRPIWKDPRIHYAVNCASYSCPNLANQAYTSNNLEALLKTGAQEYINHPRGVTIDGKDLTLSKIYSWYQEDFGNSEAQVITHLVKYANPVLKEKLSQFDSNSGDIDYEYDWRLNETN